VVKAYDPASRETITVEYPPGQIDHGREKHVNQTKVRGTQVRAKTTEKHKAKASTRKGKTVTTLRKRDEYQVIPIYGVSDRAALQRIAENRYHLIGKSERRCIAKTRDLKDMRESDMLNLSAGDAVMIDWDEFNRELLGNPGIPDETKVEHLVVSRIQSCCRAARRAPLRAARGPRPTAPREGGDVRVRRGPRHRHRARAV
jgi:hypothetical protein